MVAGKQGPVFIEERCGCRVDHGIPFRCPQHSLTHKPVHYAAEECEADQFNDKPFEPGWYFWTETWADRIGPYASEHEANEAARLYGEAL